MLRELNLTSKFLERSRQTFAVLGIALFVLAGFMTHSQADKSEPKLLRHVVLFKFKEEATEQQINDIVKAFGELPSKIDEIHSYEWGKNNSPEGLSKGFEHCFFVTFKSEEDRDAYLPHPAHQAFVKELKPILDDVTVVDYWAQ